MDEKYLMDAMSKMTMEFSREGKRQDVAQQAVDSVVQRVGFFNGGKVQNFLKGFERCDQNNEAGVLLPGGC